MMTVYGLDAQGEEVDADVFTAKLKKLVSALRRLDTFYNVSGQHRSIVNDLKFASATVCLREKQIKSRRVRSSPARRFAVISAQVSTGNVVQVENSADEYAPSVYEKLSKGSGESFSCGIIESPEVAPIRIDNPPERQVVDIISRAFQVAEAPPRKYFQGFAIETYDGIVKTVDLRRLFPEAKLVLSPGKKDISCIVSSRDIDRLKSVLNVGALVTERAQHDGKSMLPERIDVINIRPLGGKNSVLLIRAQWPGSTLMQCRTLVDG
jgi:hypothetical protein